MVRVFQNTKIKECILFVALFCAITLVYFLVVPHVAFAIEPTDTVYNANSDFWSIFTNFFTYGLGLTLGKTCLNGAIALSELANEFFSTITGSKLFNESITGNNNSFGEVMRLVSRICDALLPIGYTILGIFVGIEALRITKDTKQLSSQWLGLGIMETWLVFAIKFTVLYTLVTRAKDLMLVIYDFVCNVQTAIQGVIGDGLDSPSAAFDSIATLAQSITFETDVSISLLILLTALVCMICAAITAIYIQVLGITRIFEIFILIAMSPVSVAGLASSYTSSITAGYFKSFVGAVLQISILFLIIALAGPILATVTSSINEVFVNPGDNPSIVQQLLGAITPIVTSLSLFFMAKQSRPIADKIAGAA